MLGSGIEIVLVAILPALLVAAAIWDLTSMTIPNIINSAVMILFFLFVIMTTAHGHGLSWYDFATHVAAGLFGLSIGIAFFAMGWIGGGDAKLFACISLWLGWTALFQYALLASVFGGILTLSIIMLRKTALPPFFARHSWLLRLADKKEGVPYGIALSLAALIVLPETELFGIAVGR